MTRILVVDDERRIRELLELSLRHHGYDVRSAADGQAALAAAREWQPDAIVLDVMLPKIDGISLLPMLRRVTEAPVIMLSAKGELEDKVSGLSGGADDYLSKPFELDELIAHIEAKLRRPHIEHRDVLGYDDLSVDLQTHKAQRAGKTLDLSPLEYDLLVTLLRRPKRVFTRDELLEMVWGDDRDVTPAAVERYISYLRAKVDDGFERRLIQTVRGVGYTIRNE
ncbi:MAG TPA: response regulator transcription factor [Candidatus Baltobacteraceae bacterium]|jgi:DNA-binding response OmpR family regulator|nr:response regulator transcription factor [Candidatus Baltobacteraceae bacterium]